MDQKRVDSVMFSTVRTEEHFTWIIKLVVQIYTVYQKILESCNLLLKNGGFPNFQEQSKIFTRFPDGKLEMLKYFLWKNV